MTDWLLEVGCEELPYRTCLSLIGQLVGDDKRPGLVHEVLEKHRLLGEGVFGLEKVFRERHLKVMVSPRRIAIVVTDLEAQQTADTQRFRGPKAEVAFDAAGEPTKAGAGFARGKGLTPEQLEREVVDGTEFVFAQVEAERRPAAEVLPEAAREVISGLQVPRGMRWGARPPGADDYLRFTRPLRWLVCLLDDIIVPFDFYDLHAGQRSAGHRVLGHHLDIDSPLTYERELEGQHVIVDQGRRREIIIAGLDETATGLGGRWFDPGAVLEENVFLVEWPSVHGGSFDARHLRLPREVLITAMQSHQRYFPLESAAGELLPSFLYLSNADPAAADLITHGNQRVLEGRLDDAEFAYDRDLAEGLEAMAARLDAVTFHEKLGSLADKAARLGRLVGWLARQQPGTGGAGDEVAATAMRAAALAKADLVSLLVQDFASLQGVMGGVYARAAGLPEPVAIAIAEHYLPLSATAPLPATSAGALVAIAEKIDNIAGAWVAGEKPSGSRDPFGLRRAAMGIVRISLEHELHFVLPELIEQALAAYADQDCTCAMDAVSIEIEAFVWERLHVLLLDEGLPFPMVEAALAAGGGLASVPQRAAAARTFAMVADEGFFNDVVTAYTRCASLAGKAGESVPAFPDPGLFSDAAERALYDAVRAAAEPLRAAAVGGDLTAALQAGAALRPVVDRYFEAVMVMDDDPTVRDNRLAQLKETTALLGTLGDFSRLPVHVEQERTE